MAVEIGDRSAFEREVLAASHERPVVVDFWAPWCAPCRVLGPVLERFESEDAGRWTLVKVDVQDHPELAAPFGVTGIPAVFAFRGGEVVDQFTGAQPPPRVRAWLDGLAPRPAEDAVHRGQAAAARGDRTAAIAAFEEALTHEPEHPAALLGLAESDPQRASELLARLPASLPAELEARRRLALAAIEADGADPAALRAVLAADPSDLDARWTLAHALLAAGDRDAACAELLEIVRRDRKYRDDGARRELLAVFESAGPGSELARTWHKRLAMELFK